MQKTSFTKILGASIVASVLASACGSGDSPDILAYDDSTESATSITTEATERKQTTTTIQQKTTVSESVVETTSPSLSETSSDTAKGTTPSTSGSGGAPVTTRGGFGGSDTALYKGYLGTLARDQVVQKAVVRQPPVVDGVFPLTGLPGQSGIRPAAIVKIDNSSRARPQTGLNAADIIVEEEVEGGITRLAAVFHSTSSIVGPIRSGRTTDIGIINGFGSPLLMYSGANSVTDALLRAQPTVQNRNAGSSSGYWRSSSRRAPSNLYSDTAPHWASASGGTPPPQFEYRKANEKTPGVEASSFKVSFRASTAAWQWQDSAYLRTQGGRAHMVASGEQVSAANVVVIEAREIETGMFDSSGAVVPEFIFVGQGKATVFTNGKRIDATWTRPALGSVATLTAADGSVVKLTPGRTWIELIKANSGLLS